MKLDIWLIQICRIQWRCSLFSFSIRNARFAYFRSYAHWYLDYFEYAEFDIHAQYFRFRPKIPFLGKFVPKNQNYQFKLKFGSWPNLNILFSDAVHFFCFWPKMHFLGNFGLNCQYCQFKVKLDINTNANMQNSIAVFTFFVFDWERPFCANLVQNVKIVSLRLNLVASLIRICIIQWCCSLFSFSIENAVFGQMWSKKSKLPFYAEIRPLN